MAGTAPTIRAITISLRDDRVKTLQAEVDGMLAVGLAA
jgi:hypothetical protein